MLVMGLQMLRMGVTGGRCSSLTRRVVGGMCMLLDGGIVHCEGMTLLVLEESSIPAAAGSTMSPKSEEALRLAS